ncbi:transcriptional regulator FtsR [Gleimia hominis]|uniref:transcriptional regulator FtsR n=1 Tax=Gleimia hominis TaxID=595468 RepID=UPI0028A9C9CF|nr:MerR family transcriptional regulator [Gleimia hominis]
MTSARRLQEHSGSVEPWPRDVSRQPKYTISQVLERVKPEFPALSVSKIRYLEDEDLVNPHRTRAGYRKYSEADIKRLRYVLAQQRDSYLPLKVIHEQLLALDAGHDVEVPGAARVVSDRGEARTPASSFISVRQLMDLTGVSKSQVEDLVELGLLSPDLAGYFPTRSIRVVQLILAARSLGIAPRNLRSVRAGAERTADLIDMSVQSTRARGRSGDKERANARARELAGTLGELQVEFLRIAVDRLSK